MPKYAFLPTALFIGCVTVFGQQNFFNVPSSDITTRHKVFFQQQLNVFTSSLTSNSTFCYGLGKNLEVGLNVLGVTYDFDQKRFTSNDDNYLAVYPSAGINIQKRLYEHNHYSLAVGGQLLFPSRLREYEYYSYLNNRFEWERVKFIAGLYLGNNNYFGEETRFLGKENKVGIQTGFEYQLLADKLFFQADYFTGTTVYGNLILGGAYELNEHWILSSGYQFPNDRATSANGVIFEVTFIQ